LKLEYFIAKRLIASKEYKSSVSSPIIKIAISAIAIGMIMMIVSVATGIGLQQKIREKISVFNGHITISNFDDNQSEVSKVPVSLNQPFYPKFKSVSGIQHVQAVATKAGIIRTESDFEGIIFKGVGTDYQWSYLKEYVVEGRVPVVSTDLNAEVLMSEYLSKRLHLKIGDKFNTFFMKENGNEMPNLRVFTLVGIYNSGFQDFDATYIIGDIRHIQRVNKWTPDQVGSFEVFVEEFDQIDAIGEKVYEETSYSLDSKTIKDKYYYIFEWLQLFDFNIVVILCIMLLVATINMVVALLVLILERTQLIGILKALGANNWMIRKVFLYNAMYLIIRGLFWGNAIAIVLLYLQKKFAIIKLNPENYYVSEAPVYFDWVFIAFLNIGTLVICLLVLLIPSYIITKISPARVIRFE
jgi:lipoprotein-releasing system permease protein